VYGIFEKQPGKHVPVELDTMDDDDDEDDKKKNQTPVKVGGSKLDPRVQELVCSTAPIYLPFA